MAKGAREKIKLESIPPDNDRATGTSEINCFEKISVKFDDNTLFVLKELAGVDVLHKFNWIRLISRMFEAMAGNFAHPEDIQLFLNVLNGSMALHAGDSVILR